eukprot:5292309-Pleurochrysis_carterae.AAC.1
MGGPLGGIVAFLSFSVFATTSMTVLGTILGGHFDLNPAVGTALSNLQAGLTAAAIALVAKAALTLATKLATDSTTQVWQLVRTQLKLSVHKKAVLRGRVSADARAAASSILRCARRLVLSSERTTPLELRLSAAVCGFVIKKRPSTSGWMHAANDAPGPARRHGPCTAIALHSCNI